MGCAEFSRFPPFLALVEWSFEFSQSRLFTFFTHKPWHGQLVDLRDHHMTSPIHGRAEVAPMDALDQGNRLGYSFERPEWSIET